MKFRMFTDFESGEKIALDVDSVSRIEEEKSGGTWITLKDLDALVRVQEDFDTVFSRLNTVAE